LPIQTALLILGWGLLGAIFVTSFGISSSRPKEIKKDQEKTYDENSPSAEDAYKKDIIDSIKGIVQELQRQNDEADPKNRRERNLRKAEVAGLWTAAAVGVAAIVVSTYDASGQRSIMQRQLNEMVAEQRPWVYPDEPIFTKPIALNNYNVWQADVEFTVHNTGRLPAMNVTVMIDSPAPTANPGNTVAEYQHKNCINAPRQAANIAGSTVFPGQVFKQPQSFGYWAKDWNDAISKMGHADPWIIGCFAYHFPDSSIRHFTKFAYIVGRRTSETQKSAILPVDPSVISPNELILIPFTYKDSFDAN
jgi:hypothetical protein